MHTTRAFIAGLGTTGSLVAAAACAFLVASAVIAFNGWPGAGFAERIDNVFVDDAPPVAWDQPGTEAVAAGAGTAAGAVTATAAGPTFGDPTISLTGDGTAVRGGPVRLPDGTIAAPDAGGPTSAGAVTGGGGETSVLPSPGSLQGQLADDVRRTGGDAGRTVRETSGAVGGAVGGSVGDTVTQTGDSLGGTLDGVTQGAGDLLTP